MVFCLSEFLGIPTPWTLLGLNKEDALLDCRVPYKDALLDCFGTSLYGLLVFMHDTFGGVREDEVEDIQKVSVFNLGSY